MRHLDGLEVHHLGMISGSPSLSLVPQQITFDSESRTLASRLEWMV